MKYMLFTNSIYIWFWKPPPSFKFNIPICRLNSLGPLCSDILCLVSGLSGKERRKQLWGRERCTRSLETGLLLFIGSMPLNEALRPSIKMGIHVPISKVGSEGSVSLASSQIIVVEIWAIQRMFESLSECRGTSSGSLLRKEGFMWCRGADFIALVPCLVHL